MNQRRLTKPLRRALLLSLALLFLLEAWLWEFGGRWLAGLIAWLPLELTKRRIQAFVAPLSPWATLPVFLVPLVLIVPINFVVVWLFVKGRVTEGLVTIITQKLLGVAIVSFMFRACEEKLMQIALIRWAYRLMARWYRTARALTAPYRLWLRRWSRRSLWQIARRRSRWTQKGKV
jgi:signal transduction histidine kinase